MNNEMYTTLTGRTVDLTSLNERERNSLDALFERFETGPEWSEFGSWWIEAVQKLEADSPVYRIGDDLEARLGISQGKTAPPDYRDYLLALIEEEYESRYRFCKEADIDQGHLSRILSGKANFSMATLQRVLKSLHASLTVQTESALREAATKIPTEQVVAAGRSTR